MKRINMLCENNNSDKSVKTLAYTNVSNLLEVLIEKNMTEGFEEEIINTYQKIGLLILETVNQYKKMLSFETVKVLIDKNQNKENNNKNSIEIIMEDENGIVQETNVDETSEDLKVWSENALFLKDI